ncbi:outer membrane protein [Martelella sp. HB161492]|uniref:outer membrane protein n=1 Tax=Martelella sp. HB161492 TaxID=2720726 RepID=UPI00159162ED|nr:outer membrane protein [Martelella sp. HB161492]
MNKVLVGFVFLCLGPVGAFAADVVVTPVVITPAPALPASFDWTGFYLGGQGSMTWTEVTPKSGGDKFTKYNPDGFAGGIFAGYDYQFSNNLVLGVEGELNYNWADDTKTISGTPVKLEMDWGGGIRGRLGYAMDRVLFYGTGGWAITNAELKVGDDSQSENFNGYTFGAGVDFAFTQNLFGRVEYRYTDYPESPNDTFKIDGLKLNMKQSAAMVGLGYKF